jgi:hypothetical protein
MGMAATVVASTSAWRLARLTWGGNWNMLCLLLASLCRLYCVIEKRKVVLLTGQ